MDLSRFRYAGADSDPEVDPAPKRRRQNAPKQSSTDKTAWEGPLPPILRPGLDCVFVGFNPGLESARLGHYYAHHSNRFWKFLYRSGLVDRPVTLDDDRRMPEEHNYGFTDLVARSTKGITELSPTEMREGAEHLEKRLDAVKPRYVCFIGKGIWETVAKARGWPRSAKSFNYGIQPQEFGGGRLCVLPSTSGLNSMPAEKQLIFWRQVRDEVRKPSDASDPNAEEITSPESGADS